MPYDGRGVARLAGSWGVPHDYESPALLYCAIPAADSDDWAPGGCTASGILTVTAIVDPCGAIVRRHKEHYADLTSLPAIPPGASEEVVRAWSERAGVAVRAVLADQRNWAMFCSGDLNPDPREAILRVMTLQRDALLELHKQDKLTNEGVRELISAERQLQMMGGESSDISSVPAVEPAMGSQQGTMTVKVHSPVSLHLYDEHGRHVGWNSEMNVSESTIPGAKYEGAPGGAQTITLPAGYYKVVVDELSAGTYLLEMETNGTGADTIESFLGDSKAARTTSTHYAVTDGWDGPRLDVFPMRRTDTPPSFTFRDEGRPSMTGGATPDADPRGPPGAGAARLDAEGKGIPAPSLGVMLVVLGALAWRRRR